MGMPELNPQKDLQIFSLYVTSTILLLRYTSRWHYEHIPFGGVPYDINEWTQFMIKADVSTSDGELVIFVDVKDFVLVL